MLRDHFHRQEINGRNCSMGTGVKKMLQKALEEGYAVGSFSARYLTNIGPVLEAAVRQSSPVIVQVS